LGEDVNLRHTLEGALFYVGIPTVTLYPLGFVGLGLQMRNDPFFPYSRLDTVWDALSLVPQMEVIGAGVWLLYLSLISLALGVGVATLVVRVFLLLGGVPAEQSAVATPGRRGWMVYLLLLVPVAVLLVWNSVTLRGWHDLMFFIRFLVLSAGGGIVVGFMRLRGRRQHFYTGVAVAYIASILGALNLASTQTPQLPLIEIEVDRSAPLHECSEVPADNLFVMLEETDEYWYVYNKEGLFGLRKEDTGDIRFLECQDYLDRD
jgi:uncharacterized membrane protein YhaH (DUF805 family)